MVILPWTSLNCWSLSKRICRGVVNPTVVLYWDNGPGSWISEVGFRVFLLVADVPVRWIDGDGLETCVAILPCFRQRTGSP